MPKRGQHRATGGHDARKERPARWHGKPRPNSLDHQNPDQSHYRHERIENDLPQSQDRARIIRWVVAGIVVWGIFHAIGAWRFNHNPLRAVVVLACVAAFIGFWMTMLAVRQRRLSK